MLEFYDPATECLLIDNLKSVDSAEIQRIKSMARRSEARSAMRFCGVFPDNIDFLGMQFYKTGRVKKRALGEDDIVIVKNVLDAVRPYQIYATGDLSDPHGTHRTCLYAVVRTYRSAVNEE